MPSYTARRVLPATVDEVWAVLAEPTRWPDWWPGLKVAESTVRRALAPGAFWQIEGAGRPGGLRRPQVSGGSLLILEVVPLSRVAFQLTSDRVEVALDLESAAGDDETVARLAIRAPWLGGVRRTLASDALAKLAALVRRPPA